MGAEGDRVVLAVRDHGAGMPPDQAERVFDRFYRAPSSSRDGGSGLGLFIVATLARGFGGQASVVTAPGEGSVFTVVLPLDATAGPVTGRTTHPASVSSHRPPPSPGHLPTAGTTPAPVTDGTRPDHPPDLAARPVRPRTAGDRPAATKPSIGAPDRRSSCSTDNRAPGRRGIR